MLHLRHACTWSARKRPCDDCIVCNLSLCTTMWQTCVCCEKWFCCFCPPSCRWANGLPDNTDIGNKDFFYNSKARGYYRDFARFIVTRYRGNTAVHSWDICNQPRADGDRNGAVAKWVAETAAFVKSLDNKHPVTVGLDGFFGPSTPGNATPRELYQCRLTAVHYLHCTRECCMLKQCLLELCCAPKLI